MIDGFLDYILSKYKEFDNYKTFAKSVDNVETVYPDAIFVYENYIEDEMPFVTNPNIHKEISTVYAISYILKKDNFNIYQHVRDIKQKIFEDISANKNCKWFKINNIDISEEEITWKIKIEMKVKLS